MELTELISSFAKHFPEIDFSDVTSGYGQVERKILNNMDLAKISAEQWEAILAPKYNDLFQRGIPHISWEDDRAAIAQALIEDKRPSKTWSDTWDDVEAYYIQLSVILRVCVRRGRSISDGMTRYTITIVNEFIPVPTHRAVIIGIANNTKAFIECQFAGTEAQCEDWVAKNIEPYHFFKILPIK